MYIRIILLSPSFQPYLLSAVWSCQTWDHVDIGNPSARDPRVDVSTLHSRMCKVILKKIRFHNSLNINCISDNYRVHWSVIVKQNTSTFDSRSPLVRVQPSIRNTATTVLKAVFYCTLRVLYVLLRWLLCFYNASIRGLVMNQPGQVLRAVDNFFTTGTR